MEGVSKQANIYMHNLWTSEEAKKDYIEIKKQLAMNYRNQVEGALRTCIQ